MEIMYIRQPNNSKLCGQTCLAMAFNKDIKDICIILNKYQGTRNPDIYKIIEHFGFKYKYKRISKKNNNIPNDVIVKIGFKGFRDTHWTYKINDCFYDPTEGLLKDYTEYDYIEYISYIQIIRDVEVGVSGY